MVFGIVLFALGIMVSIVLHEYGHMRVALWSGMRVRRFFVGFGPTLWSVRRGGIEYGLKAIPLGGFCDIAGMTAYDQLSPEDEPRAMWRQAWWKRVAVLLAGPFQTMKVHDDLLVLIIHMHVRRGDMRLCQLQPYIMR